MSRDARTVKLTEHKQGGRFKCFKRMIGSRLFYLGAERAIAERTAMALLATWSRIQAGGGTAWTDRAISEALVLAGATLSKKHSAQQKRAMLHDAIKAYLGDYRERVSDSRYFRQSSALVAYRKFQPNVPLNDIGWDQLNEAVSHFRGRPKTERGTPLAVATVAVNVKAIHALYDWLDLKGQWEAPRRFDRIFRVSYRGLRTSEEVKLDGCGPRTFSLAELKSLWTAATPRQRAWMGLALGTGETAQGLASLQKADFRREGNVLVVDRHRRKTGVRGVYPLWPEVEARALAEMDTDPKDLLAFRTLDGMPLVWFHETGRVDAIAKTWRNLLQRCPDVRQAGFSLLRKTGASLVEQLTGSLDIAQLYLSHRGRTVAERHYLALHYDRLAQALRLLRAHLEPMFSSERQQS